MRNNIDYTYIRDEYIIENSIKKDIKTIEDAIYLIIDLAKFISIAHNLPKHLVFKKDIVNGKKFEAFLSNVNGDKQINVIDYLNQNFHNLYSKEYADFELNKNRHPSFIDFIISTAYLQQKIDIVFDTKNKKLESNYISLNSNFKNEIFYFYLINYSNKKGLIKNNAELYAQTKDLFNVLKIINKNNMSGEDEIQLKNSLDIIIQNKLDDKFQINLPLVAILSGNKKSISLMSNLGLEIDKSFGKTKFNPLLLATLTNKPEIIKIYLDYFKKKNINIKQEINKSFDDYQKYLINKGKNTLTGCNLLHIAIQVNSIDVLDILLDNEIDINKINSIGESPIFFACKTGNITAINKLIQNPNIDLSILKNPKDKNSYVAAQYLPEGKQYDEIFDIMETIRSNDIKKNKKQKTIR